MKLKFGAHPSKKELILLSSYRPTTEVFEGKHIEGTIFMFPITVIFRYPAIILFCQPESL